MKNFFLYAAAVLSPLLVFSFLPVKSLSQQISRSARPSSVRSQGYSISSKVISGTVSDIQGNQLETFQSVKLNIENPDPKTSTGDSVVFSLSPTSSLVEIQNISHSDLIVFGEGTSLNAVVKTKDDAIIQDTLSDALSEAFIVVDTDVTAYQNFTNFASSY